jgi:hypothetical protein
LSPPDILAATTPVVEALEAAGAPYRIGGSVASSVHGIARATLDVALVTELGPDQVDAFMRGLGDGYYVDRDMILDAMRRRSCFNVIHLETMIKVDVFVVKDDPFHRESFRRAVLDTLEDVEGARTFHISTPEDIILHKLVWFRMGDGVSERQWRDAVGVIKVQGDALDLGYLRLWAPDLHVADLLDRALSEGGLA